MLRGMALIGQDVLRKDAYSKVSGAARYVDDLVFPGMIHGRTVRSTVPCGEILSIAVDAPGCTVVDYRDIPGRNAVAGLDLDQPCLVEREIRHAAEPVVLLAHESREALLAARVDLEVRRGEAVLDPRQATHFHKRLAIDKGDLEAGFAAADLVVEGTYSTGHHEHAYLETNGVIAVPEDGGITLHGSLQCPYFVHRALQVLLGTERVRVVQAETGGGFGGKEEYPSMIACHAALLAVKSGRPVKLIYDRSEDMWATTKRHPSLVRHRTGVTRDGRIVAMDIDVLLDAGAYSTLTPVVLSRAVLHATGPYRCDHVRIRGRAACTNTPPNGAFRGFGAPQSLFAAEVHLDRIAEALGCEPLALRERNAFRPGDTTPTGQVLGEDCAALAVLEAAVERSGYRKRRAELAAERATGGSRGSGRRGIGLSLFFHGCGFTGSGEVRLASRASLELTEGGARILVANTEIGQGARTTLAQITADALGWPLEAIEVATPDTGRVPDSGPTVASRTCMVVGGLLARCAAEMKARLGGMSAGEYLERHGPLVVTEQYRQPEGMSWDDATYRGDAYGTFGWGCDVVELAVDPDTCEVAPARITAAIDVGRAIHPQVVAGQIEGGTAQGLGWALLEQVTMRDGAMANASLTDYIIPTSIDTPPIDAVIVERPYPHGPFGAKGVGELPIDGVAPAVVNALRHAGIDLRDLPASPERISECASL